MKGSLKLNALTLTVMLSKLNGNQIFAVINFVIIAYTFEKSHRCCKFSISDVNSKAPQSIAVF